MPDNILFHEPATFPFETMQVFENHTVNVM